MENNKNLNQKKKEKEKEEKPIYELLNKIGNPLQRMKNVIRLLKNVIKNLQKYLSEENNEKDYTTYFITNKNQIERRENDFLKKTQEHLVTKILGEDKKEINDQINNKEIKKVELKRKNSDKINQKNKNKNLLKNEEEKKVNNEKNEIKNELTFDCLDENIALIYKRYVKLKNDFYNTKKDKFDISKIPDIYDNIKYDLIHNKDLMDSNAYELFDEISILANFVMPFEYGITRDEKINIGLKIIKPLLNKILSDLIDINSSIYSKKRKNSNIEEDKNWSGLDATKMNANEVKSTGRHVKSRFYFTCASHIYALLNIIGYGYNSILTHNNKKSFEELMKIFDFDYCSHIIFRLFEDLNVDLQNPKRFRLEIIMSPGSNQNPKEANKEHSMSVAPWIFLNKNLNVEKMKQFLSKFN
jgi:inositol hexakisphosphate/diphosphoinositol-pentakisphosphate kinase